MTCKHEWIKHPNNELLEMCRLCDKERTKGKESQKIPDVVLSKEDIEEKPPKIPDKSLLPKIVVGMIGVCCVCWRRGGYGVYEHKQPEIARCTSPKGLSTIQIEQADKYCQKNNSINIVYTNTSFGAIRSVWCVYESSTGTYKDMAKCEKEEKK